MNFIDKYLKYKRKYLIEKIKFILYLYMNFNNKYIKYKSKYLIEKTKLIGGAITKCLLVNAHGEEIPDTTINLNEKQMVVIYYKPFCLIYSNLLKKLSMVNSANKSKCHNSHYITLHEIFYYINETFDYTNKKFLDINVIEDFAVYSGNIKDIEFFDVILDDGVIKKNDISKVPDIRFSFEQKEIREYIAFSFPVSEDPVVINEFLAYHAVKEPEKQGHQFPKDIDIFYKWRSNDSIKLSECLNKYMFDFIWARSCRYIDIKYHVKESSIKRIGVPLIVFLLYSFYVIIIDILKLKQDSVMLDSVMLDIDRKFNNNVRNIFRNHEYSHNKIEFIESFVISLIDILEDIIEKIIGLHDTRDLEKNLDHSITKIKRWITNNFPDDTNSIKIIDMLEKNSKNIESYIINIIKSEHYSSLNDNTLKHMYILSYFIHYDIDVNNILKNILYLLKTDKKDNIFYIDLLDYNRIKEYKLIDLRKIKLSEYDKKNIKIIQENTTEYIEKICNTIKNLSKHYYDMSIEHKFRNRYVYDVIIIPHDEKLVDFLTKSSKKFNLDMLYESISSFDFKNLLKMIVNNIVELKHFIKDIFKKKYIMVHDYYNNRVKIETTEISNELEMKLKDEGESWVKYFTLFKSNFLKENDFNYLIDNLIKIENLMIEVFEKHGICIFMSKI
jgi:hypothetical protein